jgi:hypothetical protein
MQAQCGSLAKTYVSIALLSEVYLHCIDFRMLVRREWFTSGNVLCLGITGALTLMPEYDTAIAQFEDFFLERNAYDGT